jgi:hypothetical protein
LQNCLNPQAYNVQSPNTISNNSHFTCANKIEKFICSEEWIDIASKVVLPIAKKGRLEYWKLHPTDLNCLSQSLGKKVLSCLPSFLRVRGQDVGSHWVWTAFSTMAALIATLVVLANQHAPKFCDATDMCSLFDFDESKFPLIEKDSDWSKHDGCYLHEHSGRNHFIRAAMTIDGFHKRHLKHTNDARKGGRDLYRKYPHQSLAAGLPEVDWATAMR